MSLGFFLFARRYFGNTYLSLLLLVLRCFTSQGALFYHKDKNCRGKLDRVSPFGNLRIKGCFAPPRSLSQQRHVLHRLLKSRHPPYALKFPVKKFENHNPPHRRKKQSQHRIPFATARYLDILLGFSLSGREKTSQIARQILIFNFLALPLNEKTAFRAANRQKRVCD